MIKPRRNRIYGSPSTGYPEIIYLYRYMERSDVGRYMFHFLGRADIKRNYIIWSSYYIVLSKDELRKLKSLNSIVNINWPLFLLSGGDNGKI